VVVAFDAHVRTIPEPSLPLTGVRMDIWREMWAQPVATLWSRVDLAPLTRLVILQTTASALADRSILAEMRQLEDRFFLNPYSRAQQRIVVGDGDDVAEGKSGDVAWFNDARRRLRD
jgi:hypothetical protein